MSKPAKKKIGAQGRSQRARMAEERARVERRRRERRTVIGIALGLAIALVIGGVVWLVVDSNSNAGRSAQAAAIVEVQQEPTEGQPIRFGRTDAPRTMTLYVDFHCVHCVGFEEKFGDVVLEAENTGQLQLLVYPMSFIDQGSVQAANGFACSARAGFPRAYFNGLFANATRQWTDEQLLALPDEVGHTATDEFTQCVTGQQQMGWVASISTTAEQQGITGTPTVLLDGETVDYGRLSVDDMRQLLAA
ncbi:DsbA family protein [Propionibacteriaceae bacterium Y2011]